MTFRTLLIANRGEIARRIARTARALGLRPVAVYAGPDASLPHAREAELALDLGPDPRAYLDADALIAAARRCGADAIHPGYGFLSERADFAEAVLAAGLTWVGPPPDALRALGDKARARQLALAHGVPVLPGYEGDDLSMSRLEAEAARVGFPLLVKATAGGGGRGQRQVNAPSELAEAVEAARREAQAGFGDDRVLLERLARRPRHIEVQLLADAHGHVVHLGERECSIQRRRQKVVEEAPSPAVDAALRARLGEAAVALARAAGYVGAGTAEFLLEPDGSFWFLEVNARLQVEHPVTEAVTGLDLVALQLQIAEGRPLPFTQADIHLRGHAIELRLCAEDPLRDHLPTTGPLLRRELDGGGCVRVDAGFEVGDAVGPDYDSLVAKLIVHGADRPEATRRAAAVAAHAWVPGLPTNLPLLRQILAHPAWAEGALHIDFLAAHGLPEAPPLNLDRGALVATLLEALQAERGPWPAAVAAGFRVEGPHEQRVAWTSLGARVEAGWRRVAAGWSIRVGDQVQTVSDVRREGDRLAFRVDDARWTVRVLSHGEAVYVHLGDGEAYLQREPRFPAPRGAEAEPGAAVAPTPGKVVAVKVAVGDTVVRGQTLVVLEAMKMEHPVVAAADGVVEAVLVGVGEAVREGGVLVRVG